MTTYGTTLRHEDHEAHESSRVAVSRAREAWLVTAETVRTTYGSTLRHEDHEEHKAHKYSVAFVFFVAFVPVREASLVTAEVAR